MLLRGNFISLSPTIVGKHVLRVIERYGQDPYNTTIVARDGDLIVIGPESRFQQLWSPEHKTGEKVWIKSLGKVGTIIDAHYAAEMYYFSVEVDGVRKDFSRDNLEPFVPAVHSSTEKTMPENGPSYRLSFFSALQGRHRPSANLFQLVATRLADVVGRDDFRLTEDGVFGSDTKKVAELIQKHFNLTPVDGEVGKGTWRAITPSLGSWRAPLRLRIAECQCTWEAGKKGYGYYGLIKQEGWWNYGIWNTNKWSAKTLTTVGGAGHLHKLIDAADAKFSPDNPYAGDAEASQVGAWFGSKAGREIQVGKYFLDYTIKPSIENLVKAGWSITHLGFDSLEQLQGMSTNDEIDARLATIEPFYERLLLHACDITVNSGPYGYYPKKTPRAWSGSGDMEWPNRLPPKKDVQQVYEAAFGGTIKDDYSYLTSDSRETYQKALSKCLWELCESDDQRVALTAELQGRCVIQPWRAEVVRRRRCCAWPEGHTFQGSFFCASEHWGIGV